VCSSDLWANLAEIYALAVNPSYRGRRLGSQLVEACVVDAEQLGLSRLMSLTYEQAFFEKLGFLIVDRQALPLKVWSQCVHCLKNQACDEIAMIHDLGKDDFESGIQTWADPDDDYDVPIQVRVVPKSEGKRQKMSEGSDPQEN